MPTPYSWPLAPTTPGSPSPGPLGGSGGAVGPTGPLTADFLGYGLLRPFTRDGKSDFAAAGGELVVRASVGQVLGTTCSGQATGGELPWRTDFGCLLALLKHQTDDAVLNELAYHYVVDALEQWEPRVRVTSVTAQRVVGPTGERNILRISLTYDIISVNSESNNVLIPNVQQELSFG